MDSPDGNRFPDLLGLVKSWIPLRTTMSAPNSSANPNHNPNTNNFPRDFWMPDQSCRVCYDCDSQFTLIHRRHHCRVCGRVFCSKCTSFVPRHPKTEQTEEREKVRVCNFCLKQWEQAITSNLVLSPTVSSASLVSTESRCTGHTTSSLTGGSGSNQNYDSAPGEAQVKDVVVSDPCENYQLCLNRSEDEDEDYFTQSNDSNFHDNHDSYQSDKDTNIIEQNTSPKPSSSPVHSEDQSFASSVLFGIKEIEENMVDIENNRMLWVPPEADDGEEDEENGNIDFEELENNGDWGYNRCSSIGNGLYRNREKSAEEHKKVMKNVVEGHFKALITQLLEVENISIDWLDIITCLAWEAASLLRPDMSKGGGMDPGGYVKIKCIASGCPTDSAVVKGVVCKKNVAHRRMRLEMKKPRILILGGALEYQRVSNLLSSFDTLLHQEMEYLRMAVAKIQAHNPNILLVEKAVSRSAQDMFLDQNISLVLNIKRPLLERISRCTGAQIVPSIDHLSNPKLGSCERFHVEKFLDKHGCSSEGGKQVLKTLMFFEDCPKPLGCTILLKGARSDELKKVKHVVQYGVFAAYHLALETSFLADEGATLPELPLKTPVLVSLPEKPKPSVVERSISLISPRPAPEKHNTENNDLFGFLSESFLSSQATIEGVNRVSKKAHDYTLDVDISGGTVRDDSLPSPSDHQSILVSLSSRCDWKKTVCESPHLLRIKYYGAADRPLGRFLREQLFDQSYLCRHCDMPSEAHVYCYTHRLGSLTISVRKLPEAHLPDGKIWMWHRCLKCSQVNKLPPANKRVVMSDAAWGLSFGKFLELSFSNHVSASRVASCGHSLHRDCLRFYGFGRMVACFRYAPIKVHNVYLPPSKLDFGFLHQEWVETEAKEVVRFVELTFKEISNVLEEVVDRRSITGRSLDGNEKLLESWRILNDLDDLLQSEKTQFQEAVQRLIKKETKKGETVIDILEVNKLRRQLLLLSYLWDQRLKLAPSLIKDDLTEKIGSGGVVRRVLSEGKCSTIGDVPNILDAKWRGENEKELDGLAEYNPSYLPIFRDLVRYGGAKLFVPIGVNSTVIPVFDDEPTSIISYALVSHDYHSAIKTKEGCVDPSGQSPSHDSGISDALSSDNANHIRVSFGESGSTGKGKYTVLCYYAKCFELLRKKCCPSEIDFVRSLSRCKKWGAQGGKSNVFFAKSLDDRFIIKQVTKTELESFIQFAPEYFKYLSESIGTKSPTCLAKILGIYQVTSKQGKGGKETKMDLLVMENLLFGRNITRLYDLKGSCRSRYNSDQSGNNKVLLDQNLIEMMPTSPIFVGNKAKRLFERAIWNDTSFLASIDVMDYSLLVGVDEERHELVLGIIDFMRQYTWDKHLETWAKSAGILGGPKNTSPTVISPKEYKKRFRKAMSAYFIVVPDQWPSSFLLPSKSFSDLSRES